MRIFVKLSSFLVVWASQVFTLGSNKSVRMIIGKYFRIYSSAAHLPPAQENLLHLMPETRFLF